jgi:hypothetical protein
MKGSTMLMTLYRLGVIGTSHAREWMAEFVNGYNTRHLHSGIGYVTPDQLHDRTAAQILAIRNRTFEEARRKHPER